MADERDPAQFLSPEEVRIFRISRQLTQEDLGKLLGVSQESVRQYEQRGVSMHVALALSAVDRGVHPWTPTSEDITIFEQAKGKQRGPKRRKP